MIFSKDEIRKEWLILLLFKKYKTTSELSNSIKYFVCHMLTQTRSSDVPDLNMNKMGFPFYIPYQEQIENFDDSLMWSSKKQVSSLNRQRCSVDAKLMKHWWFRCKHYRSLMLTLSSFLKQRGSFDIFHWRFADKSQKKHRCHIEDTSTKSIEKLESIEGYAVNQAMVSLYDHGKNQVSLAMIILNRVKVRILMAKLPWSWQACQEIHDLSRLYAFSRISFRFSWPKFSLLPLNLELKTQNMQQQVTTRVGIFILK